MDNSSPPPVSSSSSTSNCVPSSSSLESDLEDYRKRHREAYLSRIGSGESPYTKNLSEETEQHPSSNPSVGGWLDGASWLRASSPFTSWFGRMGDNPQGEPPPAARPTRPDPLVQDNKQTDDQQLASAADLLKADEELARKLEKEEERRYKESSRTTRSDTQRVRNNDDDGENGKHKNKTDDDIQRPEYILRSFTTDVVQHQDHVQQHDSFNTGEEEKEKEKEEGEGGGGGGIRPPDAEYREQLVPGRTTTATTTRGTFLHSAPLHRPRMPGGAFFITGRDDYRSGPFGGDDDELARRLQEEEFNATMPSALATDNNSSSRTIPIHNDDDDDHDDECSSQVWVGRNRTGASVVEIIDDDGNDDDVDMVSGSSARKILSESLTPMRNTTPSLRHDASSRSGIITHPVERCPSEDSRPDAVCGPGEDPDADEMLQAAIARSFVDM